MNRKTKKIAVLGLLTAIALILSYVETLIPIFAGIPGIKLGLPNLVVLILLYQYDFKTAALVSFVRILAAGFLFGNLMSILFSLAGGMLSLVLMYLLKRMGGFSIMGISAAGGCIHNIGQLAVAYFVVATKMLITYLPALLLSGLITGILIGIAAKILMGRIPKDMWSR